MKRILTTIVLIAIAVCILSNLFHTPKAKAGSNYTVYLPMLANDSNGQSTNPTPEPTTTPTPTVDPAQLKADLIAAVNNERAKAGCAPVSAQADLANGAQAWADYMLANGYGHSFALDADWYLKHGYTRTDWVSENIAGSGSPAQVVAAWMSSEAHRAVILAGCANTDHAFDIGVGYNSNWVLAIGELHN